MVRLQFVMKRLACAIAALVMGACLVGLCRECDAIYGSVVSFLATIVLGVWYFNRNVAVRSILRRG